MSIDNYTGFVRYIDRVSGLFDKCDDDEILVFRGHSKKDFSCVPAILRKQEKPIAENGRSESCAAHDIMIEYPQEFDRHDHLSCLVKMQHYGLETRLLDFTRNPLIALYFACSLEPEFDGAVVVCKLKKNEIKHHSSDTVLCLASLPFLSSDDKETIRKYCILNVHGILTEDAYIKNGAIHRLYHEIRSQYSTFDFEIRAKDLLSSCFVAANKDNDRMKNQNGLFAIYGLDKITSQKNVESHIIANVEIPKGQKKKILEVLEHFGFGENTIYPSLDRATAQIYGKHYVYEKR